MPGRSQNARLPQSPPKRQVTAPQAVANAVERGTGLALAARRRPGTVTKQVDLIVIGAGPAGLAAAVNAASEGLSTVIYCTQVGGQAGASALIENYPGFEYGIPGDELTMRMGRQAERFKADCYENCEALSCQQDGAWHICKSENCEEIASKAMIAATGIKYRSLNAPGMNLKGVFIGAAAAEAPKHRAEDVFVVGGGNSAGQAAAHFARYARSVTMLVRGSNLSEFMSSYLVLKLSALPNVKILTSVDVAAVEGTDRVRSLHVRHEGQDLEMAADALVVHIGGVPSSEALGVACDPLGYVLTGPYLGERWKLARDPLFLETHVPGLFAAGDVRHDSIKRVTTAVGDGAMAVQLVHSYLRDWRAA